MRLAHPCRSLRRLSASFALVALAGCDTAPPQTGPTPTDAGQSTPAVDAAAGDGPITPAPGDAGAASPDQRPPATNGPKNLPTANGPCPAFKEGEITVSPKGIAPRKVRIWIGSEAATKDGPLVFYWHGTGMKPTDATWSVGNRNIAEIKQMGGIVAAPFADPNTSYPWFISNGKTQADDYLVADEIVACAIKNVGLDTRRIHSTGMSAGGMITSHLAILRANYIASSSPKSGGFSPWNREPTNAEPSHKAAAMIFHGGTSDKWGSSLLYKPISEKFRDAIRATGGFAFICDHGRGHRVPTDAVDSVWQFFKAHPWNASPSPYASGLPAGFPSYCSTTP